LGSRRKSACHIRRRFRGKNSPLLVVHHVTKKGGEPGQIRIIRERPGNPHACEKKKREKQNAIIRIRSMGGEKGAN